METEKTQTEEIQEVSKEKQEDTLVETPVKEIKEEPEEKIKKTEEKIPAKAEIPKEENVENATEGEKKEITPAEGKKKPASIPKPETGYRPKIVELTEGVQAKIENGIINIKGEKGELSKDFTYPGVNVEINGNTVTIRTTGTRKQDKAIIGTYESHLKNMIKGVTEGYKYTLKVVFSHFPMTTKQVEDVIEIHNYFGEKKPRKARVIGDVKLDLQKDIITIEGINKEDVGQTSANLEQITRIKNRDTRVFQDGIYLINRE